MMRGGAAWAVAGRTLLLIGLFAAANPSRAQQVPPEEATDPDLQEALQELDEAGVPLSPEELADLLGAPRARAAAERNPAPRRVLDLSLVTEPLAEGGPDPRLGWDCRWSGFRVHGRFRRRPDEPPIRGSLGWERGGQRLRAGHVGLAWGAGLLCAAPGRTPGLNADSRLVSMRTGPVSGGSPGDRQALRGGAGTLAAGPCRVWVAGGTTPATSAVPERARQIAGVGLAGTAAEAGLLVVREAEQVGFGLRARFERNGWQGAVETARARPDSGRVPWRTLLALLQWRAGRRWTLEASCAAADGGPWWRAGRRPPLLVEDEGKGWAVRGSAAPVPGWRLAALLARSDGNDPGREGSRTLRERVELLANWKPAPGWRMEARWRRTLEREWTGSERFPWQPAEAGPQDRRMVWTATLARDAGRSRWRIRLRTQSDGNGVEVRHRNLLQCVGAIGLRSWLKLRASWAAAWGGDADLVSALAPVRGVLVPRHWGRWRSETAAGFELRRGGVECGAAVSRRVPEPDIAVTAEWNGWAGLGIDF